MPKTFDLIGGEYCIVRVGGVLVRRREKYMYKH